MDMSLATCWDCPPTFVESFGSLFVALLLLLIAVVLRRNHFVAVRALGAVIVFVAIAWLLLSAYASWRFGVAWEEQDYHASVVLTMLFMATPLVFLLAVGTLAFRRRRHAG